MEDLLEDELVRPDSTENDPPLYVTTMPQAQVVALRKQSPGVLELG